MQVALELTFSKFTDFYDCLFLNIYEYPTYLGGFKMTFKNAVGSKKFKSAWQSVDGKQNEEHNEKENNNLSREPSNIEMQETSVNTDDVVTNSNDTEG